MDGKAGHKNFGLMVKRRTGRPVFPPTCDWSEIIRTVARVVNLYAYCLLAYQRIDSFRYLRAFAPASRSNCDYYLSVTAHKRS